MKKPENHRHERAVKMLKASHHSKGGAAAKDVHKHEDHLHPGKPKTKLKDGGVAHGKSVKKRLDRPKRYAEGGGVDGSPKKKGNAKTQVNIVIAGKDGSPQATPPMMPPGGPAAMPAQGAPAIPPRPPMGAGAAPMGMPMRKKGGAVNKEPAYPIDSGAGGGEGRLEKAAAAKKTHKAKGGDCE